MTRHAGQSAASWAAQTRRSRPWWRRLLASLGWWPDREADNREAGAVGERLTADLLAPLARSGCRVLHDLALPGSRANVDHLVIPPHARYVLVPDSKLWSAKWPVRTASGRLVHGSHDRQKSISAVVYEARRVSELLGVPAVPLVTVHNATVAGGGFTVDGVRVIPAEQLVREVVGHAVRYPADRAAVSVLAARAERNLAAYR